MNNKRKVEIEKKKHMKQQEKLRINNNKKRSGDREDREQAKKRKYNADFDKQLLVLSLSFSLVKSSKFTWQIDFGPESDYII